MSLFRLKKRLQLVRCLVYSIHHIAIELYIKGMYLCIFYSRSTSQKCRHRFINPYLQLVAPFRTELADKMIIYLKNKIEP